MQLLETVHGQRCSLWPRQEFQFTKFATINPSIENLNGKPMKLVVAVWIHVLGDFQCECVNQSLNQYNII